MTSMECKPNDNFLTDFKRIIEKTENTWNQESVFNDLLSLNIDKLYIKWEEIEEQHKLELILIENEANIENLKFEEETNCQAQLIVAIFESEKELKLTNYLNEERRKMSKERNYDMDYELSRFYNEFKLDKSYECVSKTILLKTADIVVTKETNPFTSIDDVLDIIQVKQKYHTMTVSQI